ncbi:toprim domain-containing protein [Spirosoma sp.]|uniref:toprim domain-containing protein n=1 Tax=Spirosoma sp. TaxID=1899569 RepID=UPI00260D2F28|nr:toprim domain-containing protein [Spirosoma sp.]MCX6212808.1 toprim domain-containing protein [Spirosoma sp.]
MLTTKPQLSDYKQQIDLVQFLETEGFSKDRRKSTRRWPVLENAEGRKLIIGNNQKTNEYFYYNPEDSRDRGTIVDYVIDKLHIDTATREGWQQLHEFIGRYTGDLSHLDKSRSTDMVESQTPADTSRSKAMSHYFRLDPLTNTDYLMDRRGLTVDTLGHRAFIGKIFNKTFVSKKTGETVINTVFPMESEQGITAILLKNDSPTGLVNGHTWGERLESIWVSNLPKGHQPKEMLICESPIDALSYHQLHPPKEPYDRVYVATGGQPSSLQPLTVQRLIDRVKPEQVILGHDNDNSGIRFNIGWVGRLQVPGQSIEQANHQLSISHNKNSNTLSIDVYGLPDDVARRKPHLESLQDKILTNLNKGYTPDMNRASADAIMHQGNHSLLTIHLPNHRPMLTRIEKLAIEWRGLTDKLVVKRPFAKDWNEELQTQKANVERSQPTLRNTPSKATPQKLM